MKMATAKIANDSESRQTRPNKGSGTRRLREEQTAQRRRKRASNTRKLARDTIYHDDSIQAIPAEETVVIASRDTKGENVSLEIKALMSICMGVPASTVLLGRLTDKHFHTTEVKIAFKRVKFLHMRTGSIPDFQTLLNEPSISVASRERMSATIAAHGVRPCRTDKQYSALFNTMDSYAKKRGLYEALNRIGDMVRVDGMDVDTALLAFQREAANLSAGFDSTTIDITGGSSDAGFEFSDLESVARSVLTKVEVLDATGINAYDRINGGFRPKSVIIFGADTNNFKSVMMLQHAINQAAEGKRVVFYSLEMDRDQFYQRFFANLADVDSLKEIIENTRAANLERNVKRIMEKVKEIWANWTLVVPAQDVTWEWIVANAESVDAQGMYVDYIGLVKGARGSESQAQWQAMDALAREAKVYANVSGRTVVLAAQMKFEDGKPVLKYATAVKDHADALWAWSPLTVNGKTYLCVHVDKARGGRKFKFVVEVLPQFSRLVDVNLRDRAQEELVLHAIADMEAYRDPQVRYREVNAENNSNRRNLTEPKSAGPGLANGGFAQGPMAFDVSAKNDAPWDVDHTAERSNEAVANSVSAVALAAAAVAERKTKYGASAQSRRAALQALTENKTNGLSHEQMAVQADAVLRMYDAVKAEAVYGFDAIAGDIVKMQSALIGLKQQVDADRYPDLASVLNNERDKAFKRRATPSERAAHAKRIAFVQAAVQRLQEAKRAKKAIRIEDLLLAKRHAEANDGSNLAQVVDPAARSNDWRTNAVLFGDRVGAHLPNFAKPVNRRWKLSPDMTKVGDDRVRRYSANQQNALVQLKWPALSELTYLSDAQLEHMVTITNRWRGTPVVESIKDRRYKHDLALWLAMVSPAKNSKTYTKTLLTHDQLAAVISKYGIGDKTKRVSREKREECAKQARRAAQARVRRNSERVAAFGSIPKAREARVIAR